MIKALLLLVALASSARAVSVRPQDFPNFVFNLPSSATVAGSLSVQGPISSTGTITANNFVGSGAGLTGVSGSSTVSVNNSLNGDGSTAHPLAVNSSSVAVLQSGAIVQSSAALTATGAGFALNVSSGLALANGAIWFSNGSGGYIRFPDGTVMNTAPTGGGGTVTLTSTQTFTAAQKFTSSVTVGPVAFTRAVSNQGGYVNAWSVVASTQFFTANDINFTGIHPRRNYELMMNFINESATGRYTLATDIPGSNYQTNVNCFKTGTSVLNFQVANGSTFPLDYEVDQAQMPHSIHIWFRTATSDSTGPHFQFGGYTYYSTGSYLPEFCVPVGFNNNTVDATTIQIHVDAGSMTGSAYLLELQVPNE